MSGPNGEPNISSDSGITHDEEDEELSEEEFAAIDCMLEQISSRLDEMEEKNDALKEKLQELLESNKETRREFREQRGEQEQPEDPPADS